jgi:hypothetical protein
VGDGEFDSPELQAELDSYQWQYICRTAKNILIGVDEAWLSLADLAVTHGQHVFRKNAWFTQATYRSVTPAVSRVLRNFVRSRPGIDRALSDIG